MALELRQLKKLLETAVHEHQSANLNQAEALYRQVLENDPNNTDALHLLGVIAFQRGQYEPAIKLIEEAIDRDPSIPAFHNNLGNVYKEQKNMIEAVKSFRRAINLKPDYVEALCNLGIILHAEGDLESAIQSYKKILRLKPCSPEILFSLGLIYEQQSKFEIAAETYYSLLRFKPDHVESLNNLGNILDKQNKYSAAAKCYKDVIRVNPDCAEAYYNLGIIHIKQNKLDSAIKHYQKATNLKADYFDAYYNMGIAFKALGDFKMAIESFEKALQIIPNSADAHLQKAFTLLLSGNYKEGWSEYEWRFLAEKIDTANHRPMWDGSPLDGKTILVDSEQGIGDIIQFIRYLKLVKAQKGQVIFGCRKELLRLMINSPGIDKLIEKKECYKDITFDTYIPLLSLPRIFDITLNNLMSNFPYLHADPILSAQWNNKIDAEKFNVGLVWGSGPRYPTRDCPLKEFSLLTQIPGVVYHSLQKGSAAEQIKKPPWNTILYDYSSDLYDFAETAAFISHLDLIISVDTSVAHLAGAMAKPVWTILPLNACWRYLWNCEKTPWYPTMRMFRQQRLGEWHSVMRIVEQELSKAVSERARSK